MRIFWVLVIFCAVVGRLAAGDVVVASYNIKNYLPMPRSVDGKVVPGAPKPEEEIRAVVEVLKEIAPGIIGIVEMGDESMLANFQARLKESGLDYPHREWVRGADPARHLALLSRYPIVARNSRDDVTFALGGTQQRIGRGILDVTVRVTDSYRLRLVGAHLKSRRIVPEFDQEVLRAKEAWFLRTHLTDILTAHPEENLLLFGDLNDTRNSYSVGEIIGPTKSPTRLRDLFLVDRAGECWTYYWSQAGVYSRIDYLMASQGLWPEIDRDRSGISSARSWYKASDHRAIYTRIVVPKK